MRRKGFWIGLMARLPLCRHSLKSLILRPPPRSGNDPERTQPLRGGVERFVTLAEAEADVFRSQLLVLEEARAGDGGDSDVADEVPGEGDIVIDPERVDARHDVVGALGGIELEADLPEHLAEAVAPGLIIGGELPVILAR